MFETDVLISIYQQIPQVSQEYPAISDSQLMDPISSLDGFDPFLLPSVIAGMDPAYAENHWTVNGASEVVDSDSSKNSEQDDTDDFQSPNESQQIGDEVNMSEPSPRCWEHGCNGYDFQFSISCLWIAANGSFHEAS